MKDNKIGVIGNNIVYAQNSNATQDRGIIINDNAVYK